MPKTWVFRSTVGGKTLKVVLGRYPEMDFDEARQAMADLRKAADGANPIEAARGRDRAEKQAKADKATADQRRPTLDRIAERYLGVFVGERRRAQGAKRSAAEEKRLYAKYIGPIVGAMKLEDIRTKDVAGMRDLVPSPSERRKTVAVVRALLSHARSDGLIDHNPALGIKAPPSGRRSRVLTDDELRTLWKGLGEPQEGIRPGMLAAMKVQLLTAQRAGEVLAMRWADIDRNGQSWLIPATIAKNGRENFVPLSPIAYSTVTTQLPGSEYVFPGHRVSPVSTSAYAQLVDRVRTALEMNDFTSHDLRRTAATKMAALGILPHVVEAILNHASGTISGVAAIYNRHTYAAEKKRALQAWAREIERIASGKAKTADVVAIGSRESG
jgi:integrase